MDLNTQFIEHIIFIMKNVLDTGPDTPVEHLGVTSIEGMMLAIVRLAKINMHVNIICSVYDVLNNVYLLRI